MKYNLTLHLICKSKSARFLFEHCFVVIFSIKSGQLKVKFYVKQYVLPKCKNIDKHFVKFT